MDNILFEILKIVVMIVALIGIRYVIPWVKALTENIKMKQALDWVKAAVDMAQQVHKASPGEDRKGIVTDILKEILTAKNIALSDTELDVLIEAAVKVMKREEEKAKGKETTVNVTVPSEDGEAHAAG